MKVVVRVDAAPGFEGAVEQNLRRVRYVTAVGRHKHGNFDLVVQVDVPDEAALQRVLANDLRTISGVRALQRVDDPGPELLRAFEA